MSPRHWLIHFLNIETLLSNRGEKNLQNTSFTTAVALMLFVPCAVVKVLWLLYVVISGNRGTENVRWDFSTGFCNILHFKTVFKRWLDHQCDHKSTQLTGCRLILHNMITCELQQKGSISTESNIITSFCGPVTSMTMIYCRRWIFLIKSGHSCVRWWKKNLFKGVPCSNSHYVTFA